MAPAARERGRQWDSLSPAARYVALRRSGGAISCWYPAACCDWLPARESLRSGASQGFQIKRKRLEDA